MLYFFKSKIQPFIMRKIFLKTTDLDAALDIWRERLQGAGLYAPLDFERIAVTSSLGRITSEPISALISSPFFNASAMDGYAVRFTDTFGASETTPKRLKINSGAVYVDTGDPMPDGFNAVIMIEDVNKADGSIEIISPATPWQNVRPIGEDIVSTELIAPVNHKIRPVDIGALLAGGHTEINVRRRPVVAVIPTGDEIVEPGSRLKKGDIIEYNSRVIGGLVESWGASCLRHEIVPDKIELIKAALLDASQKADLIVINAGASAGSGDYTEQAISELGSVILHGLNIKPGKPAMLGFINNKPVIGAPGYPVSTYLVFTLFAKPLISKWLGEGMEQSSSIKAIVSRQIASPLGLEEFIRVKLGRVGERMIATPLGRGAGLIMSLCRADGFLRVPAMSEGLSAGAEAEIALLRRPDEIEQTIVCIGSHDNCIDLLANALKKHYPNLSLSSAHVGSMGGLMAIKRGEAHVAPTHLLDEETGEYNTTFIKRIMPEMNIALINLVYRQQGLILPKGNPKGIKGFANLTRPDVAFINRQRGAGTRLLLDKHLKELNIDPNKIIGYDREEYTHMAVASAVLTGAADVGLGVLSAANALNLDFMPVANERYDLAIPEDHMQTPMIKALMEVICDDNDFKDAVVSMGGYDVSDMGRRMG